MASTSLIPPQHPATNHHPHYSTTNHDLADSAESVEMASSQWPALNSEHSNTVKDGEWEIVPPSATAPVVTFDAEALQRGSRNPKLLKHSQSSPDLRAFHNADDANNSDQDADEESSSAVLVEDETSMASSSNMDLVSEPPSVWSVGSNVNNKLSFKEAILQKPAAPRAMNVSNNTGPSSKQTKKAFKPKFVVVKPSSSPKRKPATGAGMKRPKSMGNLRALDHIQEDHLDDYGDGGGGGGEHDDDGAVLGETDAGDFYNRKAHGALGRKNAQKTRPDEAKRLQITMAKKTLQKQRQMKQG